MTMPNTNPSDLDREARTLESKLMEFCTYMEDERELNRFDDIVVPALVQLRATLSLPRASGVPEAERRPDAYQQLKDGKWVECSEFVARGWGDKLDEGTRALFAAPPPVATPSVEAWREGYLRGFYDSQNYWNGDHFNSIAELEADERFTAIRDELAPTSPIASEPKDAGSGEA